MNRFKAPSKKPPRKKFKTPPPPKAAKPATGDFALYKPYPTAPARKAIHYTDIAKYTQHKMQDRGRSIALGRNKREILMSRNGDTWLFRWTKPHGVEAGIKYYTVTWNGIGQPPAGVSTSTYSQGKDYTTESGAHKHLAGQPDQYTWAVWFMVNGAPDDSMWPPIPSRNPTWAMLPTWVEYPYPAP